LPERFISYLVDDGQDAISIFDFLIMWFCNIGFFGLKEPFVSAVFLQGTVGT
jgi:hypothetical protein